MSTSDVGICNIALSLIGTKSTISALTESSAEARQCLIHYDGARDYVLRAHPWKFAQKRVTLALVSGAPTWEYSYRYQVPADCLKANEIIPPMRNVSDPIPFEVVGAEDLKSKNIVTNKVGAELRYTGRVTAVAVFDPDFELVVAWWLGTLLVMPLTGDKVLRKETLEAYKSRDPGKDRVADHIAARL